MNITIRPWVTGEAFDSPQEGWIIELPDELVKALMPRVVVQPDGRIEVLSAWAPQKCSGAPAQAEQKCTQAPTLPPMPAVTPEGDSGSLNDWYDNNVDAVEWFLENAEAIRSLVEQKCTRAPTEEGSDVVV